MPRKIPKSLPPGAGPYIRGYWAYVFGEERAAPEGDIYSEEYRRKFYDGYDEARRKAETRNTLTRG